MESTVEGPVYKQLVGVGTAGDFVKETQGVASEEGFSNVSRFWYPTTVSYEDCIEKLEKERSEREDIRGKWEDWKFAVQEEKLVLENQDGRAFTPTEHALGQAAGYSKVDPSFILKTLSPEFEADETDLQQLTDMLNYRKQRFHQNNKGDDRNLIFRTYGGETLRAVLSEQYAPIDNVWLLGVLNDLIPGGRVSHLRGNSDNLFTNILLPDNIRHENDGDYGGLFAIKNSEIGQASFDCTPSLYRSICQNGCIWSETRGLNFKKVHKGKIVLKDLAMQIGENLDKQIKIIPAYMEKFLSLRQYEFHEVALTGIFSVLAERYRLTPAQGSDIVSQFAQFEKDNRNPFGIINSITRSGQLYEPEVTREFDLIGGELVNTNWDVITKKAASYSKEDMAKILGLSI